MKVTIELHQDKLRLRWMCPETGKRKNLALGVDDSTTGRAFAATIKDRIENDAKHGYYDSSLLKYRPLTIGKNASEIATVELFDRFTQHQFKSEGLAKSSIKSRYEPLKRMFRETSERSGGGCRSATGGKFCGCLWGYSHRWYCQSADRAVEVFLGVGKGKISVS